MGYVVSLTWKVFNVLPIDLTQLSSHKVESSPHQHTTTRVDYTTFWFRFVFASRCLSIILSSQTSCVNCVVLMNMRNVYRRNRGECHLASRHHPTRNTSFRSQKGSARYDVLAVITCCWEPKVCAVFHTDSRQLIIIVVISSDLW